MLRMEQLEATIAEFAANSVNMVRQKKEGREQEIARAGAHWEEGRGDAEEAARERPRTSRVEAGQERHKKKRQEKRLTLGCC